MNKKQFLISLIFLSVFSFLGGIVGGMLSGGKPIFAKDDTSYTNPKKIDFLESEYIKVKGIVINSLWIQNDKGQSTVQFANNNGNPFLNFYSKENPLGKISSDEQSALKMQTAPMFSIWVGKDGVPKMQFNDNHLDRRMVLGIYEIDPMLIMYYNNNPRLVIGTNEVA